MWQQLMDVLGKLGNIYDELTKLGEKKRDALVGIDMEGLAKILDTEQILAAKIQKLEQQRGNILKELSKSSGLVGETTKALDFYKAAPSRAVEDRLVRLHKVLSKNVDRALVLRENNNILARGALDAVSRKLNQLTGTTENPGYGKGGDVSFSNKKALDFKA